MNCPICLEDDDTVKVRPELSGDSMCDLCAEEQAQQSEIHNEELRESMK